MDIFKKEFLERVCTARKKSDLTQAEIADRLGIERDTYKQYEKRTYLPNSLVAPFCEIIGVRAEWLLSGEGEMEVDQNLAEIQALQKIVKKHHIDLMALNEAGIKKIIEHTELLKKDPENLK